MKNISYGTSVYQVPDTTNPRGFYPETDDKGRPTGRLLDSGNWKRRRNKRYRAVRDGQASSED